MVVIPLAFSAPEKALEPMVVRFSFQFLGGNGVVFHGGGDNVLAPFSHALYSAEDGPVVRLCTAGSKENFIWFSTALANK